MPTPTIQKLSYALCATLFVFGSGYACPPPNQIEPEDSGEGDTKGSSNKKGEILGDFVDRKKDCIDEEKGEGDCDGFPGKKKTGREKGKIIKNFKTIDSEGEDFELASLFQLDKKGVPKYKSIVFYGSADW